jgi:hypothetical protein
MINCGLDGILTALLMIRAHMTIVATAVSGGHSDREAPEQYKGVVLNILQFAQKMARQHGLQTTEDRFIIIWSMCDRQFSWGELAIELKTLLEAFEADLRKEHFYHLSPPEGDCVTAHPG